jgi:hypothetical protein
MHDQRGVNYESDKMASATIPHPTPTPTRKLIRCFKRSIPRITPAGMTKPFVIG